MRLFSDGNPGIVFCFGNALRLTKTGADRLPGAFAYGQISCYRDVFCKGETELLIVVFNPYGLFKLLGIPGLLLKDQIIGLSELTGDKSDTLAEQLEYRPGISAKISLLNSFFTSFSANTLSTVPLFVTEAIKLMDCKKGNLSIVQLVKYTGYTERHLERIFKNSIGISPEKLNNVLRLHNFIKEAKITANNGSLNPAIFNAGYFDQSHLIREFKKITGITPGSYLKNSDPVAANFIRPAAKSK